MSVQRSEEGFTVLSQTLSSSNNSSSWEVISEKDIEVIELERSAPTAKAKSEPKTKKNVQPVGLESIPPPPSRDPPKLVAKASANMPKSFEGWDLDDDVPPPPLRNISKPVAKASANVPKANPQPPPTPPLTPKAQCPSNFKTPPPHRPLRSFDCYGREIINKMAERALQAEKHNKMPRDE